MKKDIIQSVKLILLSLAIGLGVSYVYAWTGPQCAPPGCNVEAPVNVSAADQNKVGGLGVGAFVDTGNAYINGSVGIQNNSYTELLNIGSDAISRAGLSVGSSAGKAVISEESDGYLTFRAYDASGNNAGVKFATGLSRTPSSFTILPNGNVGINTTAPSQKLDVNGMTTGSDFCITGGKSVVGPSRCLSNVTKVQGGFIAGGGNASVVSDSSTWNVMSLNGQYTSGGSGDSGAAGGYIYQQNGGIYAQLFSAQVGHKEFYVNSSVQCISGGAKQSSDICVQLSGSMLTISTGSAIQLQYIYY